jgi:hypothetical protein
MSAMTCGHHRSLSISSAETGKFLYCELCNVRSERNDAVQLETELRARIAELERELRGAKASNDHHRELVTALRAQLEAVTRALRDGLAIRVRSAMDAFNESTSYNPGDLVGAIDAAIRGEPSKKAGESRDKRLRALGFEANPPNPVHEFAHGPAPVLPVDQRQACVYCKQERPLPYLGAAGRACSSLCCEHADAEKWAKEFLAPDGGKRFPEEG